MKNDVTIAIQKFNEKPDAGIKHLISLGIIKKNELNINFLEFRFIIQLFFYLISFRILINI